MSTPPPIPRFRRSDPPPPSDFAELPSNEKLQDPQASEVSMSDDSRPPPDEIKLVNNSSYDPELVGRLDRAGLSVVKIQPRQIKIVDSVGLATAEARQKPSPWSRNMFKLYLCFCVAFLYSTVNGYGSCDGIVQGFDSYKVFFGTNKPQKGTGLGATAARSISLACAGYAGVPIIHYWGRRWGIFVGALICFITKVIDTYSPTMDQPAPQITVTVINSIGWSIMNVAIWVWATEIAHPSFRGPMVGSVNCFYFLGQTIGTFVVRKTATIEGNWSWRVMTVINLCSLGIIIASCLFLPESPRWLIKNAQEQKAIDVMAKYWGDDHRNAPIVQLTLDEIKGDISRAPGWWDLRALINTREARYRFFLCFAMGVLGQWAGNAVVTQFYSEMLAGVGASDLQTSLLLRGIQSPIFLIAAILGALSTDKIGRRKQLLFGSIIFAIMFAIITPLSATSLYQDPTGAYQTKSPAQARAFISMVFFFSLAFAFCFTPLQVMYQLEVLPFNTRAMGYAASSILRAPLYFFDYNITSIIFRKIGWRYYLCFVVWNILAAVFIYRYVVETKNRTLEELTAIFRSKFPVKTSRSKSNIVIEDEQIIVHETDKLYACFVENEEVERQGSSDPESASVLSVPAGPWSVRPGDLAHGRDKEIASDLSVGEAEGKETAPR